MRLKIEHVTNYLFSTSVYLEPHRLYFYPLFREYIDLRSFEIDVNPQPSGLSIRLDAENNAYHQCWFQELTDNLLIKINLEVETREFNPLDFIVDNSVKDHENKMLEIYLTQAVELSIESTNWISELYKKANGNLVSFLSSVCTEMKLGWDHEIRFEDNLLEPNVCFKTKMGSCRDLSWLLINLLRYKNIPARFVSGYSFNPELEEGHELHAWVEAWLPGSGWIGLDPSSGLFTTHNYIPVAVSYHPSHTFPVQGSYRGDATSKLETTVKISVL